jgi:hypothetical protein
MPHPSLGRSRGTRSQGDVAQSSERGGAGPAPWTAPLTRLLAAYVLRVRDGEDGITATVHECDAGESPEVRADAEPIATGVAPTVPEAMSAALADARFPSTANGSAKAAFRWSDFDPPTF